MTDSPYPDVFPEIIARAFELGAIRVTVEAPALYNGDFPWEIIAKFKKDKTAVEFKRELKAKYPKPYYCHAGYGNTFFYTENPERYSERHNKGDR